MTCNGGGRYLRTLISTARAVSAPLLGALGALNPGQAVADSDVAGGSEQVAFDVWSLVGWSQRLVRDIRLNDFEGTSATEDEWEDPTREVVMLEAAA